MPEPARRAVSLRTVSWKRAGKLRDELAEKSGRRVTLSDTVERALDCLEDAHRRGAWLSPAEASPVLEDRMRREIVSVLHQFIARWKPDVVVHGVTFKPSALPGGGGTLAVHLDEGEIPMLMGGAEIVSSEQGQGHHA